MIYQISRELLGDNSIASIVVSSTMLNLMLLEKPQKPELIQKQHQAHKKATETSNTNCYYGRHRPITVLSGVHICEAG